MTAHAQPQPLKQHWRPSPLGLGPMETAIMRVLWQDPHKWLTVRQIQDRMDYPPTAHPAAGSVVRVLAGKGMLTCRLGDRSDSGPWQYRAAGPAHEHIGNMIAVLLDHSPNPAAALKHALSQTPQPTREPRM
jgi:predicted transcriptional regulator